MQWQEIIKTNVTTAEELRDELKLSDQEYETIREEIALFPMSVSRYYLSLIDPDDPDDPIRKMAIPSGNVIFTEGDLDTSGEHSNTKLQGLQHKYRETAMVLTTAKCAMFCRHCFRRRLVGKETDEIAVDIDPVVNYLKDHPEINNVLLSGGDAFMNSTERIDEWLSKLSQLDQLDFIRFGTRTPVTFPERILNDPELLETLNKYRTVKRLFIVTHFNHPNEFTEQSVAAVNALQKCGIVVKNQTVLMKGVNDDPEVLSDLLRKVSSIGMVQHYIFQCRPVKGVKSHFQLPIAEGSEIVNKALAMQNGIAKSADYTMSHVTGKIRILGKDADGYMVFQYKQAKNPADIGRIFRKKLDGSEKWLEGDLL